MMIKTIEQKALNFINDNYLIERGDKILVSLSGGPDSVFLLLFLIKYKRRFKIEIGAFHLNHRLRGEEADEDEKFCSDLANEYGIEFFTESKNVKLFAKRKKLSIEEAGREIRYAELKKTARKYNYTKIATAHNADDNTETILLNLFKGGGLKGFAGIPVKRENIIRPVLILSKSEIVGYLKKKKIEYRLDSSNLESGYQRNYLRNNIIPLIRGKINPDLESALFRSSNIVNKLISYIDDIIYNHIALIVRYKQNRLEVDTIKLNLLDYRLHGYLFKELLKKYFDIDPESKNILDIEKLLSKQVGKKIRLSDKLIVSKERNKLVFISGDDSDVNEDVSIEINAGEQKKIGKNIVSVKPVRMQEYMERVNTGTEFISADRIKTPFVLRRWRNGDRFYPLGMKGSKKISDFLTEQKVDSHKKGKQLVLTNNRKIVWVVGMRIDDRFKVTEKTRKVYELCLE
ncbi:tRNA(Ile)-lysidine synthase [bacterium BMS3Abin03]|nr:tRNA(Ile)-lysidine synthase [bacterium BMS3Abin03]